MASVVRMPAVLANATEAVVQTWLVKENQRISVGTPLAEVETDKAVVDLPSDIDGVVLQLIVAAGQSVTVGEPIAVVGEVGETFEFEAPPSATSGTAQRQTGVDHENSAPAPEPVTPGRTFASPIVRKLARNSGVDLADVRGTGPDGRINRRDFERYQRRQSLTTAASKPQQPAAAASPPTVDDRGATQPVAIQIALSPMRRAIARRLHDSKTSVPHFYVRAQCRVDELIALRAAVNDATQARLSINDFVLKAAAVAYTAVPAANVSWGETVVHQHPGVDIAVAVAVDDGLLTPVVRDVDGLSISALSAAIRDLAARARSGTLRQHEIEGGVATVSNLGMFGVQEFAAIINPPQSAILAVGASRRQPIVDDDGELAAATLMSVTLSADHRVLDGALAAQWLQAFVEAMENPLRLLM